jgi:rhodanese-related sulfurtransferase
MPEDAFLALPNATPRRSRLVVGGFAVLVVVVGGYFVLGMPGMDHGDGASMSSQAHRVAFERLSPGQFAARAKRSGAFVVNVHTPYEGTLPDTDVSIPYDRITADPRLPTDKSAEILLYCRSGRMSVEAARALTAAGYTNVADLDGGMLKWESTGRPILQGDP